MSDNKKALIVSIVAVTLFIAAIASASYAFYVSTNKTEGEGLSFKNITASVTTTLKDNDLIDVTMIPGDTFEKTFTITNNAPDLKYHIAVFDLVNEFESKSDITYVLTEDGNIIGQGQFPSPGEDGSADLNTDLITLPTGEERTYKITITYNDTENDQSADMGKVLSGRIFIRGL